MRPYNTECPSTDRLCLIPYNDANTEYRSIVNDPASRNPSQAANKLNSLGLTQVQDFEIVYARKLNTTDYYFNPQVGFISVNQTLQANDVLAVAYQYSYNGHIYQVGEFSQDVPPDTAAGTGAGFAKGALPEIAESHLPADQPADLEPDDEERLFPEDGQRQLSFQYPVRPGSSSMYLMTNPARGQKDICRKDRRRRSPC